MPMNAISPPLLANMGTPLMWASLFHLTVGNALIGCFEGWLIARWFGLRRRLTIPLLIIANYVSALLGVGLLFKYGPALEQTAASILTLANIAYIHAALLVLLIGLSAIIEWPFCMLAFWGRPGWSLRGLRASLYGQLASHGVLILAYGLIAFPTVRTILTMRVREPATFAKSVQPLIYYISPTDGALWRIRPDGSEAERLLAADVLANDATLYAARSEDGDCWDLWVAYCNRRQDQSRMLIPCFADSPAVAQRELEHGYEHHGRNLGYAAPRPAGVEDAGWTVRNGFWAAEGLWAKNSQTGRSLRVAYETPLDWSLAARNPTILPGEQVVYQLGDQIVLLDLNTRTVGVVARGRGPLVVLDPPSAAAVATQPG
jgi:hypothetical protein